MVWRIDRFLFLIGQKIILFGYNSNFFAGVVELVDTLDLGSSVARRESSSLSFRTIYIKINPVKYQRLSHKNN